MTELKGRLPDEVITEAAKRGVVELTPPQEIAVNEGLLSGRSIVVAAPTASGKTFIAEMAMLRTVLWQFKKAVYIAPMRALASEKYDEFKSSYPFVKVALSIGDLDSLDSWLGEYDIIFVSTEKFDSLMRRGISWLESIGCIIFDEIHLLDEIGRGPTLEILLTRLKRVCSDAQFIALSATIGNAQELRDWLGSGLVESSYRPVPLEKGVELEGIVSYLNGKEERLESEGKTPEARITEDTLRRGKQAILFYATKRNAEAGAERLSKLTARYLKEETKPLLMESGKRILSALGKPTLQCEKLSGLVGNGIAFHHSGLVNEQRREVEDAFKNGEIKVLCSTTTLGIGVNLPAHTVVVRDTTRYRGGEGSVKIGANEVAQLFGRAGRPRYDTEGRAMLIARSKAELKELWKRYIDAELSPIVSKIGVLPVLRMHLLSFIASGFLHREDSMLGFLSETFYGYQYGNSEELKRITSMVLRELQEWKFIEDNEGIFSATRIGRRVSELYINPISAKWMIDSIPKAKDDLGILFMVSNTPEMVPYSKVAEDAWERMPDYNHLIDSEFAYQLSHYEPERPFSTALMLDEWISEANEYLITKKYGETPGSLFTKIQNADWLLHASAELARLMHMSPAKILEVRVRTKYGIKKELLDLVRLEQVGRVRARVLHSGNIRSVAELREKGSEAMLTKLFGREVAQKIWAQVSA